MGRKENENTVLSCITYLFCVFDLCGTTPLVSAPKYRLENLSQMSARI